MVLIAISLLYLVNVANAAVQWFILKTVFITDGRTRGTSFAAADQTLFWGTLLNDIFVAIVSVVADGLLIWRCYNIWGNSLRAIFLSLVLVIAETALYISIIIIACVSNVDPSVKAQMNLDKLISAALFMTLGATLLTTVLIAHRICSVTRQGPREGVTRPYRNIAEMLVQSSAAYSLVALWNAVMVVIPDDATAIFCASQYAGVLLLVTAGMMPTIMVVRVAIQASEQAEDVHTARISDLEFRRHSSPSGSASQVLSQGIRVRVGGRDDISSEVRDSEKQEPAVAPMV
ncbi:hypothetical protein HYPSUDRAFT_219033 [Hypholoma sublateritium FD-334 SS-4]|uniref:G-protein coupled receptors family 1 profile domain-containing protein n=1 Tax=Hypholoma sublateritium (strain FD-334 SS-4) TaxID=945553 RepID=A0A0D2M271_HYPSF|nr:hypothetical protein HYPSUDRAFT_219033 [Hypholoma sublateritium FD-334 SS-4]